MLRAAANCWGARQWPLTPKFDTATQPFPEIDRRHQAKGHVTRRRIRY